MVPKRLRGVSEAIDREKFRLISRDTRQVMSPDEKEVMVRARRYEYCEKGLKHQRHSGNDREKILGSKKEPRERMP